MGKTAGQTKNVSTTDMPSFQKPYVEDLFGKAKSMYEQPGPGFFPGSTVAPFADAEQTAQSYLQGSAPKAAAMGEDWVNPAYAQYLKSADVGSNSYVQNMAKAATQPIQQSLMEEALPAIRTSATAGGVRGGSRENLAESQAVERTARAMGNTSAGIFGNAYAQGLDAMGKGISMAPQMMSNYGIPASMLQQVGGAQREMSQANINEQMARYQYDQNLPYQKLAEYSNYLRMPTGGQSTSEVTGTPPDKASQIASLILSGAGTIPGLIDLIRGIF